MDLQCCGHAGSLRLWGHRAGPGVIAGRPDPYDCSGRAASTWTPAAGGPGDPRLVPMAVFEQHTTLSTQYPFAYAPVFNAAHQAIEGLRYKLVASDPDRGTIRFSTGMSLASWGESLEARIAPVDPQQSATAVQLTSSGALPTLIGQGRRNRKVINRFFEELGRVLTGQAGAPAQG